MTPQTLLNPASLSLWNRNRPRVRWAARVAAAVLIGWIGARPVVSASNPAVERYTEEIQPILEESCYGCHGLGARKGGLSLDEFAGDEAVLHAPKVWEAVLKNVRAGLMPPPGKPAPTAEERQALEDWIKYGALGVDPNDPDPGRVTVRRLNRVEYRNTVRDLIGVDYDAEAEFPPDDTGHGFDNIGDVLTTSPLLLEKYLGAAEEIVSRAVPTVPKVAAEQTIVGRSFRRGADGKGDRGADALSYYAPATSSAAVEVGRDGRYELVLELSATERFVDGRNDLNRCRLTVRDDGEELVRREFAREEGQSHRFAVDRDWKAGSHVLTVEVEPLAPAEEQVRSLAIRIRSATIRGPMAPEFWVRPPNYARFFPREAPDADDADGRRSYARELIGAFAARAFRRPVDDATIDRLAALAESVWSEPGRTFEAGVAQAMTAVLASPRFLFREEGVEDDPNSTSRHPLIDEYALASRLSYFFWSTAPDDELIGLAAAHKLRTGLAGQVDRMLADRRSAQFYRNFVGQWLQARDVDSVVINAAAVMSRDQKRSDEVDAQRRRLRELFRKTPEQLTPAEQKELNAARARFAGAGRLFKEYELTGDLRRAMRRETEMCVEYVVRENRPLVELIDADYTFLNARLAKVYGIEGVEGDEMRRVALAEDSPRGGLLTQGTVLTVTSNPDRTSPVKRGLFILDNILGTPPAPQPPNIPPLEESGGRASNKNPSVRELMVLHRDSPYCYSCHARMDPLGLAFENFNALGRWRDSERGEPVDASGTLPTGEVFRKVNDLKKSLVANHRLEFHRCVTEKLLTYALGRGLEPYDVETVDAIVARLEADGGRSSDLIAGVVQSAPFQRRRRSPMKTAARRSAPSPSPDAARASLTSKQLSQ